MALPASVTIVEVGPRDGLQNIPQGASVNHKIDFIDELHQSGLKRIEVGSFVSDKKVPQMSNTKEVIEGIKSKGRYSVLTPNLKGYAKLDGLPIQDIALLMAASQTFSQKNTNCSIEESLARASAIIEAAKSDNKFIRAYLSCAFACPYEGEISPSTVKALAQEIMALGVDELSLADTIGASTPNRVSSILDAVQTVVPSDKLAVHFHHTYGQGLVNTYEAIRSGVQIIDSASAGLGGCPYAKGAAGNIATEDLVYLLHGLGIDTGVNLDKLIRAGEHICQNLNIPNASQVAKAYSRST